LPFALDRCHPLKAIVILSQAKDLFKAIVILSEAKDLGFSCALIKCMDPSLRLSMRVAGFGASLNSANDGPPNNDGEDKKNFLVTLARYSQLAFVLPACTVVGWLIGVALDRWLHTSWLYLAGLIVGIAAGFVELIRTVVSSEKS
jgi:F0F1-type ATP synthase assembly protein I